MAVRFILSILITISLTSWATAKNIKPNERFTAYEVLKIQLEALKNNDKPKMDNGIEQTWLFAHPQNKMKNLSQGPDCARSPPSCCIRVNAIGLNRLLIFASHSLGQEGDQARMKTIKHISIRLINELSMSTGDALNDLSIHDK